MVEEEETDLKEDQLNTTAFIDDEATTNLGSLQDTKDQTVDGGGMLLEEPTEKEVLFNVYNGFFQFQLDDYNIPKTEYGVVGLDFTLGDGAFGHDRATQDQPDPPDDREQRKGPESACSRLRLL